MQARRSLLLVPALAATLLVWAAYPLWARGSEWWSAGFRAPWFLLALLALPLVFFRTTFGRDRLMPRLRLGTVLPLLQGPLGARAALRDLPGVLRSVAFMGLVLALARPVNLLRPAYSEDEGIDIVIALDLSGSMEASISNVPDSLLPFLSQRARGVLPTRFEVARAVLRDFIARRKTDRIGVVVFGMDAYVLSPPTLDYHLLDSLVSRLELKLIAADGTAIGDALGVSLARLRRSDAKSKVVLLLTDGDNKGGKVTPEQAAGLARELGVKVYPIQVGEGDMAQFQRGFDLLGQPSYVTVPAPTNPALLRKIAEETGGKAFIASDARALQQSVHTVLDKLERSRIEARAATYEELYRYLLLPSVLLLALEALVSIFWLRRFP